MIQQHLCTRNPNPNRTTTFMVGAFLPSLITHHHQKRRFLFFSIFSSFFLL